MKYLYKNVYKVPLYRGRLVIMLTNSKRRIRKYVPDFNHEYIYAHAYGCRYKKYSGYYMILNFDFKQKKIKHSSIIHESIHLTYFIANERGIKLDYDNDEPITYLAEWIATKAYKTIKKYGFKIES